MRVATLPEPYEPGLPRLEAGRLVLAAGREIVFTGKQRELVEVLWKAGFKPVRKDALQQALWNVDGGQESNLDKLLTQLRGALRPYGSRIVVVEDKAARLDRAGLRRLNELRPVEDIIAACRPGAVLNIDQALDIYLHPDLAAPARRGVLSLLSGPEPFALFSLAWDRFLEALDEGRSFIVCCPESAIGAAAEFVARLYMDTRHKPAWSHMDRLLTIVIAPALLEPSLSIAAGAPAAQLVLHFTPKYAAAVVTSDTCIAGDRLRDLAHRPIQAGGILHASRYTNPEAARITAAIEGDIKRVLQNHSDSTELAAVLRALLGVKRKEARRDSARPFARKAHK